MAPRLSMVLEDGRIPGLGLNSRGSSVTSPSIGSSSSEYEAELSYVGPRKRRRTISEGSNPQFEEDEALIAAAFTQPISRVRTKKSEPRTELPDAYSSVSRVKSASFDALGLQPWLSAALKAMAITRPTGIQAGCIPKILEGRDCIGGSRTGSGKTVAFAVPILQKWAEDPIGIFALVLTPTRELALQIFEQFKALSAPQSLKALLVTGGADQRLQAISLSQRPHIVIATPGRLAEHIRTSGADTTVGLRRVRMVVLDEADRLLDSSRSEGSMLPDVSTCLSILPPAAERQTLLFTATVTSEVRALKSLPRSPSKPPLFICEVDTAVLAIPTSLTQLYLQAPVTHRDAYLHTLLLTPLNMPKSTVIFCNRTATAELLHHLLRLLDHRVTALHSKLPHNQRVSNLARFRASAARILVATDVAARGLDIPQVGLVVNYDVPRDPDDYIHRVGRTARAGQAGTSVTFVGQRDVKLVLAIEERVGRKMGEYSEEGVNIETRVVKENLRLVGTKRREALLEIEEDREVGGGARRRGLKRLKGV